MKRGALSADDSTQRLSSTVSTTHALLDTYARILSQSEHASRLLLNPTWDQASDLASLKLEDEAERAEAERQRLEAEDAEAARVEAERARADAEARRAAEAAAPSAIGRGTARGRGRGVPARGGRALAGRARGLPSRTRGSL